MLIDGEVKVVKASTKMTALAAAVIFFFLFLHSDLKLRFLIGNCMSKLFVSTKYGLVHFEI